jgi:DNA-binding HxlR family transcriptional regulator
VGEYGQFCPVAKAAEILDERWTMLVVRELVAGSSGFSDIHRGVPRMSRTLLSRRLKALTRHGLVHRQLTADGPRYRLTDCGRELADVIDAVGRWGIRWMSSLSEGDLDPALLVWDMHRRVDTSRVPATRTVVEVGFPDVPADLRAWWLVITPDEVDVCDSDPGFGTDLRIEGPIRTLARVWRGDVGWDDALRAGRLTLTGPTPLRRGARSWFRLSPFAPTPRPARRPAGATGAGDDAHDRLRSGLSATSSP